MSPDWGRIFGQQSPEQQEARAQYDALLAGMIDGSEELQGLPERLRQASQAAGMKQRGESRLKTEAWEALAARTLADDILTEAEENELGEAAEALGFEFEALLTAEPAILTRLGIAKANDGRLPVVDDPTLMTKSDEVVHAEYAAQLMKEVTHREFQGGSRGVSFRVAKGVRFSTGAFRGHMVVTGTSLEPADEGVLSITDRRLVFQGSRKVQESRYDKLVGLEVFLDALQVAVTNRQTPSLYMLGDGQVAGAYVNAAAQKTL